MEKYSVATIRPTNINRLRVYFQMKTLMGHRKTNLSYRESCSKIIILFDTGQVEEQLHTIPFLVAAII